ncbi:hypothetical protein HMPREF9120_00372 [Neisseria sp. oral taxon 020 str. F0370]|nr:hypothetical protein HMPREF9120_00372 [Neisseria sp. oral taxon 020 str. F0370]
MFRPSESKDFTKLKPYGRVSDGLNVPAKEAPETDAVILSSCDESAQAKSAPACTQTAFTSLRNFSRTGTKRSSETRFLCQLHWRSAFRRPLARGCACPPPAL